MASALTLSLALAALLIEALIGYPDRLYRALGHPVTWMAAWLTRLESWLNQSASSFQSRRLAGAAALAAYLAPVALVAGALQRLGNYGGAGFAALAVIAASLPAQRSLATHVEAVAAALEREGLPAARMAVGKIVGRNVEALDDAGVCRAALESLAENFSDGVVAPVFWLALAGLPGGALYKAVNTADSMIGHRSERYLAFGWSAARLDDLVNLPASRLSALWLALAALFLPGESARGATQCVWRDAHKHRSPNAGWPEAAMAGALGLRLSGPRAYGETRIAEPFIGDGRIDANAGDIRRALELYRRACAIQALALAALAAIAMA